MDNSALFPARVDGTPTRVFLFPVPHPISLGTRTATGAAGPRPGGLFSGFEMPGAARYHLLCRMVRPDAATSSATLSDRSPRSATGSLKSCWEARNPRAKAPRRKGKATTSFPFFAPSRLCVRPIIPRGGNKLTPGGKSSRARKMQEALLPAAPVPPRLSPPNRDLPPQNWKSASLLTNCRAPTRDLPQRQQNSRRSLCRPPIFGRALDCNGVAQLTNAAHHSRECEKPIPWRRLQVAISQ